MATDHFTASDNNATGSQLAKRFPINSDPFSVWYFPEGEDNPWAINDENGVGIVEVRRRKTAIKIASALKQSHATEALANGTGIKVTPEQMEAALEEIATMAITFKRMCWGSSGDEAVQIFTAERMASQIGWIADRCLGFDIQSSDDWLLPKSFKKQTLAPKEAAQA